MCADVSGSGDRGLSGRIAKSTKLQKNYAIGIDLGGTNMRVALVSRSGEVIKKVKKHTSDDLT